MTCVCGFTAPWASFLPGGLMADSGIELRTCPECYSTRAQRIPWCAPEDYPEWYGMPPREPDEPENNS